MSGLLEMVTGRTQALDQQMSLYQARDPHEFYVEGPSREVLNGLVEDLKALLQKNQNMEATFTEIRDDVAKVGDIQAFLSRLDDLDKTVG